MRERLSFDDSSLASARRRFVLNFVIPAAFFDDGTPVGRLRAENLSDASLLDNGVGVRAQAYAHEEILNVAASPRDATIDEVLALPRAIQPAGPLPFRRASDALQVSQPRAFFFRNFDFTVNTRSVVLRLKCPRCCSRGPGLCVLCAPLC